MKEKSSWKKIWHFIWKSDSAASWVVDLIIAFLLVRFVIFPILGLLLSTALPLVVIESGSMEHPGADFDDWWKTHGEWYAERNITWDMFREWEYTNGLNKGDVIITRGKEEYTIGDIIIFQSSVQRTPIIHRIVNYDKNFQSFETKGDNNPQQLVYEKGIKKDQIISEAVIRIPKVGWVKLIFVELLRGRK